ncbi:hypothetical protein OSB94_16115 [Proteus vulgaris]|uniref:hypothetical protein n=1 Tax=Proteus vulgaris TaxID=585 RepID=UPI002876DEE1|nr:hypothetical protein [Proteus vulgaris]MDS0789623.1 hypothetical protein [Proteus vulgaris]
MKNPKLISKPFAQNGQKNVIPEKYETSMESNQATWDQGFGQITMLPVSAGGLPPKGQDFNGILNQMCETIVHISKGGVFKFSADYATAISGYPKGAILQSEDEKKYYQSLIDNNKVNFNTASQEQIKASWKLVMTDDLLDQLSKKLESSAVVQSTGTSTTSVMSQKASTDAFQPKGIYPTTSEMNAELNKKVDKASISQQLANDVNKVPSLDLVTKELGGKQAKGNYADKSSKSTQSFSSTIISTNNVSSENDRCSVSLDTTANYPRILGRVAAGEWIRYRLQEKDGTLAFLDDISSAISDLISIPILNVELNKKVDKASISQQLANDVNKVPSLDLVTKELGGKQAKGNYQPKGDYQPAGNYAQAGSSYTKSESDERYEKSGKYKQWRKVGDFNGASAVIEITLSESILGKYVYVQRDGSGDTYTGFLVPPIPNLKIAVAVHAAAFWEFIVSTDGKKLKLNDSTYGSAKGVYVLD